MTGNLFIVCAPSGAGKTSLVNELLKADPGIKLSVSYTTRKPRAGEVDGREYHFVTEQKFAHMAEQGEFLESALVHGNQYGTSQRWISEQRTAGNDILLEIDWQGAFQVRKLIPESIGIFILPPSFEALLSRLNKRAQDAPDMIALRLAAAREEISHVSEFNYVIINDTFNEAAQDLISIVRAQRLRASIQLARHSDMINRMN
ncbi:MAG: guanylate kinase [Betaproteobacteria bacterium]|nr:guanylate kinase [Betaproteobacteria bacterium]